MQETKDHHNHSISSSSEYLESQEDIHLWFREQWNLVCNTFPEDQKEGRLERLHQMFQVLGGHQKPSPMAPLQSPYSFFLPGLTAQPFHDYVKEHEWVKRLESSYPVILEELMGVLNSNGKDSFVEYVGDGTQEEKGTMTEGKGDWKVLYFYHNFVRQEDICRLCPKTAKILDDLGDNILRGMLCFSAIEPGTHILPHTGPSNMRLTAHLGMTNCENVLVTVGEITQSYEDGKVIVFDDSFRHEVYHKGKERRITLMLDLWHPDLLKVERDAFLMVMQNSIGSIDRDKFFHSLHIYVDPKNKRWKGDIEDEEVVVLDRQALRKARAKMLFDYLFSLSDDDKK
eukprot:TRINITY_DN2844_c0_g4_i1.p1 TRINITY_DN2844_c0_g4~~TRINITY_DN2844_c0_g4_i1.p1  ORF type:complete len:342 (+),score=56.25 TRINITY_DN2844_c0_g4_i1:189-1214(+)